MLLSYLLIYLLSGLAQQRQRHFKLKHSKYKLYRNFFGMVMVYTMEYTMQADDQ